VVLDRLEAPIVLAPLAGGPATPELTAEVCEAGGLGFVASGYLSAAQTAAAISATRARTRRAFGVNLFVPGPGPTDPAIYADYVNGLRAWSRGRGVEPGEPRYSDDEWDQKLELLLGDPPAVVSFVFGCPSPATLRSLKAAGSETWVTVTDAAEAEQAVRAGADALIAQGAEAGGHRASFVDRPGLPAHGLLALLQALRATTDRPVIATGAIATGNALAAVLAAGARAAQLGTAFMLCPAAGTSPVHRAAIAGPAPTALTRAFTGRLARGIENAFMAEHRDAPVAYPELHYATAPIRRQARERGDAAAINLWAGEAHALARAIPAAEVIRTILDGAGPALAAARSGLGEQRPSS
jgi:nitronate monooxygenase